MENAPEEPEYRDYSLKPEQELRLEVDFSQIARLKITCGTAEIFGSEIVSGSEYVFQGRKLAVFTWTGCTLSVSGTVPVEYVAGDTPMHIYLNAHLALQELRKEAAAKSIAGPRVILLGPSDVGKTSVCKMLLNYAIKQGSKPLFVDIDTNEGSVSIPGTLTATSLTRTIDPEEDLGSTPMTTNTTPLAFYYGYSTPLEKPKLYSKLMERLADIIEKKCQADPATLHSGMIINAPSQFVEGATGFDLLNEAISFLKVEVALVMSHERLYSDLKRQYQDNPSMTVLKLAKSGGVVNRDRTFRRQLQMQKVREYFYGTPHTALGRAELNPYSLVVPFNDLQIRRVGEGILAPSSALPLGMERKIDETRMVKVDAGSILLHSVLALSNATKPVDSEVALTAEEESKLVLETNIAGFIYISAVDEAKHKMTILSPAPGKLPGKYLIMGGLKWMET